MAVNKPFYVADASVILKWFLAEDEKYRTQAVEFRADYFFHKLIIGVPDFALAEILNILGRKFHRKKALSAFSSLLNLEIPEHRITLDVASVAFEIMNSYSGISFYDSAYHALAMLEGGIFLTDDQIYFSKVCRKGHIMLLKNYGRKR